LASNSSCLWYAALDLAKEGLKSLDGAIPRRDRKLARERLRIDVEG
jgi:hypothetical protein